MARAGWRADTVYGCEAAAVTISESVLTTISLNLRGPVGCDAYASLGGQDASKATWAALGGRLLNVPPVLAAAARARERA
eukprot:scaffold30324_cov60-Phaeocystis_antarctica.AAC.2